MEIPKWLKVSMSADELAKIEAAVQTAEAKTSGEVVPMIVHRSTTNGHVSIVLFLIFCALFFAYDLYKMQLDFFHWPLWILLFFNLAIAWLLSRLIAKIPFVERNLTSKNDQIHQVQQRAINEFYNHRVNHTENSTGILVFISLVEHRAVVLGDVPIASKIPQEKWQEVVDILILGIKRKSIGDGFVSAVEKAGEILSLHFPEPKHNHDELPNKLIIKE